MENNWLWTGVCLSALVAAANGTAANAQVETAFELEEIVVTAQKRSENLQEVPISLSAVSGEKIQAAGLARPEDLSILIPNFSIYDDPIGDKINIRGIQSGNNAGLEQSVSTFVDGVYRGRGVQSRFAFLDVERVEVLRGPQGTLFGKNTIGGAINITSAKPTEDFEGSLSGTYTFDNIEEREINGHVSGALSDNMRLRVAGLYRDLAEGHITNQFYLEDSPQLEELGLRATLEWDATDATLVTARIEHGDFDLDGQPFGIIVAGPLALFDVEERQFDQAFIGSVNAGLDIGSSGNHNGDSTEASLSVVHDFSAGSLTIIAAYSAYDFARQLDSDFSPLDLARFDDFEDFEQTSLELRYASEKGKTVEYLAGIYLQQSELEAIGDTFFNVRGDAGEVGIDTLLAAGCGLSGGNPLDRNCILSGLITAFDGTPLAFADFNRTNSLDQDTDVAALFAQATWHATDKLSATLGIRYSYEKKTATQAAFATDFATRDRNDFFDNAGLYASFGAPTPFAAIGEGQTHINDLSRRENNVTWSSNVKYQVTNDLLVYATASTGFKAGGFNSFALSADPAEAEFEEESAFGAELGTKMSVLNGRAELNIAAFYTDFSDLQTALFTGSTSFIVQNASSASSRGIEIDGRWALSNSLLLSGGVAYVDFEFDDFPGAGCFAEQLFQFRLDSGNPLATLQDCGAAGVNDLSGRTSENTPEFSGSLSLSHRLELSGGFELNTLIDAAFQSAQFRQADLDPTLRQGAYAKVNLATTFGPVEGAWDISLTVKNIFDENTFSYGNDAPLLEGTRLFIPELPRTMAIRLRTRF